MHAATQGLWPLLPNPELCNRKTSGQATLVRIYYPTKRLKVEEGIVSLPSPPTCGPKILRQVELGEDSVWQRVRTGPEKSGPRLYIPETERVAT